MMKKLLYVLLCSSLLMTAEAQQLIELKNPSFEGEMGRPGKVPNDWLDCGFAKETPPDIQPDATFSVVHPAQYGKTYLGLVVRDNNTWESVAQPLTTALEKDSIYQCGVYLSRSENYISVSRVTEERIDYTIPSILRIWGGNEACEKAQLLGETEAVSDYEWQLYQISFRPQQNWKFIILEAYYAEGIGIKAPYCGNIMVDNVSLSKI